MTALWRPPVHDELTWQSRTSRKFQQVPASVPSEDARIAAFTSTEEA